MKRGAKNLSLIFLTLFLIFSLLNLVSAEVSEDELFYPEDAMPCNLKDVTELIERYAETCQKFVKGMTYRCETTNPDHPNRDVSITFEGTHVTDVYKKECLEMKKILWDECYIPYSGSGRVSIPGYLGSVLELQNARIGYPNVGSAPSCFKIRGADLCDTGELEGHTSGRVLVAECKAEIDEINGELAMHVQKAYRNLLYTKSELVDDGYVWFNEAPKSAKINGLRKRAETASMSLGRTAYDSNRITELDEFRVAMTYYLKAKGGAYNLAKEYYDFKPWSNEFFPSFPNRGRYTGKEELIILSFPPKLFPLVEFRSYCLHHYRGGICYGMVELVSAFYLNTWPSDNELPSCDYDSVKFLINRAMNAIAETTPKRISSISLNSMSQACGATQSITTWLSAKQNRLPFLVRIDIPRLPVIFERSMATELDKYKLVIGYLSYGRAKKLLVSGYIIQPIFGIFSNYPTDYHYIKAGSHALLAIKADSNGDIIVYDPNFQVLNTLRSQKMVGDDMIILSPMIGYGEPFFPMKPRFRIMDNGIKSTGNFLLHTKNCKCDKICEDYNNENYYFLQNGVRTHLSLTNLDWAIRFLSDDYFSKRLEYQYADSACFDN